MKPSNASKVDMNTTHRTTLILAGLFGVLVFGLAALLSTSYGQELLGVQIQGLSSLAGEKATTSVVNCVTAPCPEDQNDFNITFPAGNEQIQTGQTLKIRWDKPTTPTYAPQYVRISLAPSPSCLDQTPPCAVRAIAPYVVAEKTDHDGEYDWAIPATTADAYLGEVKIQIEVLDQSLSAQSNRFTLSKSDAKIPGVIAPTATDTWEVGQTHKIKWYIPDFAQSKVEIRLFAYGQPEDTAGQLIASRLTNNGEYSWKVPTSLPNDYYIRPVFVRVSVVGAQYQSPAFWLQVSNGQELAITTGSLSTGYAFSYYSAQISATGGAAPYRWSAITENSGLTIDSATGLLSGVPRLGTHRIAVKVLDSNNDSSSKVLQLQVTGLPTEAPHAAGSLVLNLDNIPTSVWLLETENGVLKRRAFANAEIFLSHGYKWSNIVYANGGDGALPIGTGMDFANGTLLRDSNDLRTFYVLYSNKEKRGFGAFDVFRNMGYNITHASTFNLTGYTNGNGITASDSHAPGTDIVDNGVVYRIMSDNTRMAYSSLKVYNTWHTYDNDFSKVYPANSYDRLIPVSGMMQARY